LVGNESHAEHFDGTGRGAVGDEGGIARELHARDSLGGLSGEVAQISNDSGLPELVAVEVGPAGIHGVVGGNEIEVSRGVNVEHVDRAAGIKEGYRVRHGRREVVSG
jgi:hypothetical protein